MCFVVDEAARTCGRDFRIWSHLSDASFPGTEKVCREVAERLSRPIDLDICPTSAFDALQNQQKQAFGKTGVFLTPCGSMRRTKTYLLSESEQKRASGGEGQPAYMGRYFTANQWEMLQSVTLCCILALRTLQRHYMNMMRRYTQSMPKRPLTAG